MRIWDLAVMDLCDRHLLGKHRGLHAVWSILTTGQELLDSIDAQRERLARAACACRF